MKLFVANIAFGTTDPEIIGIFGRFGAPASVVSFGTRGFAFVEISDTGAAARAIAALDGSLLYGRRLAVKVAEPAGTVTRQGFVQTFDKDSLSGFIKADTGERLLLYVNQFRGVWPDIGQRVEFQSDRTSRGMRALNIRPIDQ